MFNMYRFKKEDRLELFHLWKKFNNYRSEGGKEWFLRGLWNIDYIISLIDYLWNRYIEPGKKHYEKLKGNPYLPMFGQEGALLPFCPDNVFIHMIEMPLREVPLYIGSTSIEVVKLAKWRLKKNI